MIMYWCAASLREDSPCIADCPQRPDGDVGNNHVLLITFVVLIFTPTSGLRRRLILGEHDAAEEEYARLQRERMLEGPEQPKEQNAKRRSSAKGGPWRRSSLVNANATAQVCWLLLLLPVFVLVLRPIAVAAAR